MSTTNGYGNLPQIDGFFRGLESGGSPNTYNPYAHAALTNNRDRLRSELFKDGVKRGAEIRNRNQGR